MSFFLSDSPTPQGDFNDEKFQRKSTFRDYVIYAAVSVLILGVIGGGVYYFTRSDPEKNRLHAKLDQTKDELLLREGKKPAEPESLPELKAPKQLEGILDMGATGAKPSPPTEARTEGVSAYSGGKKNTVLLSDDPALPKASPAFIQFAQTVRVSGVFQGPPAKAVLNGHLCRAGESIDAESGVTFVGVDGTRNCILLSDKTGAELRLTY